MSGHWPLAKLVSSTNPEHHVPNEQRPPACPPGYHVSLVSLGLSESSQEPSCASYCWDSAQASANVCFCRAHLRSFRNAVHLSVRVFLYLCKTSVILSVLSTKLHSSVMQKSILAALQSIPRSASYGLWATSNLPSWKTATLILSHAA